MSENDKSGIAGRKDTDARKKGWWKRFLERLAKSNRKLHSDCGR